LFLVPNGIPKVLSVFKKAQTLANSESHYLTIKTAVEPVTAFEWGTLKSAIG